MWCRRPRTGRQRRPSRSNGCCIRRPKTWRSHTGLKSRISFLPAPTCFRRRHFRMSTGLREPIALQNHSIAPDGWRTAFRSRRNRPGPGSSLPLKNAAVALPAPAQSLFEIPEGLRAALAASSRHAEQRRTERARNAYKVASAVAGDSRALAAASHMPHMAKYTFATRPATAAPPEWRPRAEPAPARARHRSPLKHLVQVKKRNV